MTRSSTLERLVNDSPGSQNRWGMARASRTAGSERMLASWVHAFDHDTQTVACGVQEFTVLVGGQWLKPGYAHRCQRCRQIVDSQT